MSDDAALTIRSTFPRPEPTLVARFRGVPTGNVADAQGRWGAIDHGIRLLTKPVHLVGTALTVWAGPRDNLGPWVALDHAKPGDVLVIATGDYTAAAVIGDIVVGMARNAGIAAIVTDGAVRDLDGIDAVGIPVWARAVTPNSPWKNGPAEIGTAVSLGGRTIASGDILVGDRDGLVVVPLAAAEAVAAECEAIRAKESAMEAMVRRGDRRPGWLDATLAQKGVRYLEG